MLRCHRTITDTSFNHLLPLSQGQLIGRERCCTVSSVVREATPTTSWGPNAFAPHPVHAGESWRMQLAVVTVIKVFTAAHLILCLCVCQVQRPSDKTSAGSECRRAFRATTACTEQGRVCAREAFVTAAGKKKKNYSTCCSKSLQKKNWKKSL